jgi:RNA recognition motif-containing protein
MGWRPSFIAGDSGEVVSRMDVMLYVGNLSKSTTEAELKNLFSQVGEVTSLKIMTDRLSGESKEYGFLTMSAQSEADSAVSRFNAFAFGDHKLKVGLAKPRVRRGATPTYLEP